MTTTETIGCPGYFTLSPTRTIACSRSYGHGELTLVQAIAQSCNVFFCTVGSRLGASGMDKVGTSIGLGNHLHTELWRQESAGIAFAPAWVMQSRPEAPYWRVGDSANAAIGQGSWITTPLQMAVMTAAVTTGRVLTPTFVRSHQNAVIVADNVSWPEDAWAEVLAGMRDCVASPEGTGKAMRLTDVSVLAKTGTAENVPGKQPHAWTIAALPAEKPALVGVCIVEHGGSGGRTAAPILRKIMAEAWKNDSRQVATEAKESQQPLPAQSINLQPARNN